MNCCYVLLLLIACVCLLCVLHKDDQVGECCGQKRSNQLPVHLRTKKYSNSNQVKIFINRYRKETRGRNNRVPPQAGDVEIVQLVTSSQSSKLR